MFDSTHRKVNLGLLGGNGMIQPPTKGGMQSPGQSASPASPTEAATPPSSGGGGGEMPSMMQQLQQMVTSGEQSPPTPVGGGSTSPADVAELQPPTIFDTGNQVEANPALGKRSPAMEGLLGMFRGRSY